MFVLKWISHSDSKIVINFQIVDIFFGGGGDILGQSSANASRIVQYVLKGVCYNNFVFSSQTWDFDIKNAHIFHIIYNFRPK